MSADRPVDLEALASRVRRLEQQIRAFRELHGSELQIILDELTDVARALGNAAQAASDDATRQPDAGADPASAGERSVDAAAGADPAANSPKRAKWLAEQERRAGPVSRREFLRGREDET